MSQPNALLAALVGEFFRFLTPQVSAVKPPEPARPPVPNTPPEQPSKAEPALDTLPVYRMMRAANPHAQFFQRGKVVCMQEEWPDPDGRIYIIEYRSTPNARHATAWCRLNPWGGGPGAGSDYMKSHVRNDGLLCLGEFNTSGWTHESPFDFNFALRRGRFWCTAFSYYMENGVFPDA